MAKRPSLGHQMWKRLESKKAIGQSRHKAKLVAKESEQRLILFIVTKHMMLINNQQRHFVSG